MFCTKCGKQIQSAAKFCTSCGQMVVQPASPEPQMPAVAAEPVAAEPVAAAPVAESASDPYKPEGMTHADYAYQGLPTSAGPGANKSKRGLAIALVAVSALVLGGLGIAVATSLGNSSSPTASSGQDDSTLSTQDETGSSALSDPLDSGSNSGSASWVPVGFTLWDQDIFDYDMAYNFVTDEYSADQVDCSGCSFWAVSAVSEAFCPGGAYAEIDILDDSGTKIDWTNDTVDYVDYGETVTFILKTYEDAAASAEITELNCYEE